MQPIRRLAIIVAALALVAAGCGDDSEGDEQAGPTTTVVATPARIVSLSPTATEILFAVGAGEQVVAVDDQSNHPPDAPKTSLSGFQPNIEAIAGYEPDLVVVDRDVDGLVGALEDLGSEVLVQPAAEQLSDTYDQIEELGRVTGNAEAAETVVADMKDEFQELQSSAPDDAAGRTYYHELDPNLFTVTSKTFIGQIYGLFGLENIADAADKEGTGYPQLSAEFIVDADPHYVFLADTKCCGQDTEALAARAGWGQITAVRDGNVVALDDDIASRWGPRVVDFARAVAAALEGGGEGGG